MTLSQEGSSTRRERMGVQGRMVRWSRRAEHGFCPVTTASDAVADLMVMDGIR